MKRPIRLLLGGLALLGAAAALAAQPQDPARQTKVIHGGTLIDGTSTLVRERVSILIDGACITDVQRGFVRPAGAR